MKLFKLSQLSADKWYLLRGRGAPIKFMKSNTTGWLRGDKDVVVQEYRQTYGNVTGVSVKAEYIDGRPERFPLTRRVDEFLFVHDTWFIELDITRYETEILSDLCDTYGAYQEKKAKVTDILRKLNPNSVV